MYHELGDTDSFSSNPPNNLELHDDHLPTSNKIEIHHTVSADDSLFGLALKYDQSTQNIMSNNNMSSETIYPGQKLKILVNKSGSFIQNKEEIKKSIEKDPEDQAKIEEEIGIYIGFEEVFQNDVINPEFGLKVNCSYCTSLGEIVGVLSIFQALVCFKPDHGNLENKLRIRNKNMEKFQAFIDLKDIVKVEFQQIKSNELFLQVLLNSVGDCKNDIYNKKVKEYKSLNKAMASAFFKIQNLENFKPFLNKLSVVSAKLNSFIDSKRKALTSMEGPTFSFTKIPFYDIISQKDGSFLEIQHETGVKKSEFMKKKLPEEYLPKTKDISTILNKLQFHDLIQSLPPVLRICNWHLIYATMKDGSCFEVLFRLIGEYDYPNILVIKDWKGNIFGAYFNEGWKRKRLFYGAGETFLYTFKTTENIKVFSWTRKNNYFMLTNGENGICVGTGDYFGLYIHPDLTRGYSFPSETFDNDFLTDEKDFSIERLEIWMVDYDEIG